MAGAPADLVIRELVPTDRAAVRFAFGRLGKQSRFQHFHGARKELSARELERLTPG